MVAKTPYVCKERYDGSPWSSYPTTKGRAEISLLDAVKLDPLDAMRSLRVNPVPVRDQESLLQTWLYFGLIAEFLGANSSGSQNGSSSVSPDLASSIETLDTIYDIILLHEGDMTYVRLDDDGLKRLLEIPMSMPQDIEAQRSRYHHLNRCLEHTNSILMTACKEFNHSIRFSIASLAELLSYIVINGLRRYKDQTPGVMFWSAKYFTNKTRRSMMEHGWCPSDIARCEGKFTSLQSLYVLQMMDKSLPKRDHTKCTEYSCNIYQIDSDNYHVDHREDGCSCGKELAVDSEELTRILFQGDQIPLLRLEGNLQDLRVELVESTASSKYVAISHIWADGLGNPHANSLHRCKLLHLRELVAAITSDMEPDEGSESMTTPLIWLDTLCCPAKDGKGKTKGIEKIYNVYANAEHVLVLDSGLMSYAAEPQADLEQLLRIFTSAWMRRLWTLQEGALATSLYFQFSDKAVCLQTLRTNLPYVMASGVQQQSLSRDVLREFWELAAFFHRNDFPQDFPQGSDHLALGTLDRALQFRGVSIPTDEPLCIGALMSLDVAGIMNAERKEDRMKKVWELLAARNKGLPAQIIFFDGHKIEEAGWRWAPRSLLQIEKGIFAPSARMTRWAETQLGKITPHGLRVEYPGYRITLRQYDDGRPRNPWLGFPRIPESMIQFRDAETGRWYFLVDQKFSFISQSWTTDEERIEYNKLDIFPLHDLADRGDSVVICNRGQKSTKSAIMGTLSTSELSRSGEEDGLRIKAERQVVVDTFDPGYGYILDMICKLALRLRSDEMTDTHLRIFKRLKEESGGSEDILNEKMGQDEEFKASLAALKQKMKDITNEVIAKDEKFIDGVKTTLGESFLEHVWVLIRDWFRHGYIGTKLGSEQVWFVD